jgi:hypothetical protein
MIRIGMNGGPHSSILGDTTKRILKAIVFSGIFLQLVFLLITDFNLNSHTHPIEVKYEGSFGPRRTRISRFQLQL